MGAPNSSPISAGDTGLAEQYNFLRNDMLENAGLIPFVNKSGGQLVEGDLVIFDKADSGSGVIACTTTTVLGDPRIVGVVADTVADNDTGYFRRFNIATVTITGTVNVGDTIIASGTAKVGVSTGGGGIVMTGMLGFALTSGSFGAGTGQIMVMLNVITAKMGGSVTKVSVTPGTYNWSSIPTDQTVISGLNVSGNNRLLVVLVFVNSSNGGVTNIKYGGATLTQQGGGGNSAQGAYVFTLLAPTVGTANITITTNSSSGNVRCVAIVLNDVNQSSPCGTGAAGGGTSTNPNITATVIPGDYCVGGFVIANATDTPSDRDGQSAINGPNLGSPTNCTSEADDLDPAASGTQIFTWTVPNSAAWRAVLLGIHPL